MTEDINSQIRMGIGVIVVSALIAAGLNLLVVAQSVLSSGLSTLTSGVDQVGLQEFEKYNQKKISGTEVKSAISLYQGRDVALCTRTSSCIKGVTGAPWCYVYGSLLTTSAIDAGNDSGLVYSCSSAMVRNTGDSFYTAALQSENGIIAYNGNTKGVTQADDTERILDTGRYRTELIKDSTGAIIGMLFTQIN